MAAKSFYIYECKKQQPTPTEDTDMAKTSKTRTWRATFLNGATMLIDKKCLAIDIPETLRAIEIRHPGKQAETDRQCAYFDPRGRVVSTMPEHLNPRNKE